MTGRSRGWAGETAPAADGRLLGNGQPGPLRRTLVRIGVHLVHLVGLVAGDDIVGRRCRLLAYGAAGARFGAGSTMHGATLVSRPSRLVVGDGCFINRSCYFDLEGPIVLGDEVTVGHGVTLITTVHELGPRKRRAGEVSAGQIVIGDRAWIEAEPSPPPLRQPSAASLNGPPPRTRSGSGRRHG